MKIFENRKTIFFAIPALALFFRLGMMLFSPLEYDEIWTLENFSNLSVIRIFSDLALPNNHPLNTLMVKLWAAIFNEPQLIRIHSLLCGVGVVLLSGVLARGLFHNRRSALWSMFFAALSTPLVVYSALARGYMTQLFFLMLFFCGLVWSGRLSRFVPGKITTAAAIVTGAVGAVISVPTAPIFLSAAVISGYAYCKNKNQLMSKYKGCSTVYALVIAAGLSMLYLGLNYSALREAQRWGGVLDSFSAWESFIGVTLSSFVTYAAIPLLVIAAFSDRRRMLLFFLFTALTLGSAAIFRAGPPRAYLVLAAAVALGCGRGAHTLVANFSFRFGKKLGYCAVLLAFIAGYYSYNQLYSKWQISDFWGWFRAAQLESKETLVIYPATTGYPLVWNNRPEVIKDYYRRLEPRSGARNLLVFAPQGKINGMNIDNNEVEMALTVRGRRSLIAKREAHYYKLLPAKGIIPAREGVLVVIPPLREEYLKLIVFAISMKSEEFISLNPFFNYPLTVNGGVLRSRIFYFPAPEGGFNTQEIIPAEGVAVYRIAPGE